MEQIGISKSGAQAENVVPLRVFWYWLHNSSVDNDQVLGCCLHGPTLARIARVEKECGAFEAHPVAFPASFASQFYLMLLTEQPFLDAQKSVLTKKTLWSLIHTRTVKIKTYKLFVVFFSLSDHYYKNYKLRYYKR